MKTNRKTIKLTKEMVPANATHPGLLIADELEAGGIKQKDLADRMEIAPNMLSEIIHGKRNITSVLAIKLEMALGIDAMYWMRLQAKYEIDLIKIKLKRKKSYQNSYGSLQLIAQEAKAEYKKGKIRSKS